ncbi:MAG: S41 family peptidase [Enterobacterales bacterium]|nr:S41 family peptidase [Enterobacterales bacterium]
MSACAIKPLEYPTDIAPIDRDRVTSLIAVELLRQDINQLVKMVQSIHPEPFAIISKIHFLEQAERIKQSLQYPLSRSEFYIRIAPLVAQLRDIHSQIKLPKYPPSNSHNNNRLFPLAVLYEKQGLYVAADLSPNPQIRSGSQIVSINGAPIDFLLDVMRRMTAYETQAGLRRRVQIDFPWLLWVMGYASQNYQIEYLSGLELKRVELEGIMPVTSSSKNETEGTLVKSVTETNAAPSGLIKEEDQPIASFYGSSQLADNTRLLWFNDFKEKPQAFQQFLQHEFETMQRQASEKLIIDVRYNDGGLSQNIKTLLSYISNKPVYWSQRGELQISSAFKILHHQKTKQRRKNKYKWGLQWLPLEWTDTLQYEISWSDNGEKIAVNFEPVEPKQTYLPNNILLLVNGFCYSACSSLVATVNQYSLAQTLGEISGNYARVQYAYPIVSQLKNSHLKLMLPTMKLEFTQVEIDRRSIMNEATSLVKPKITMQRSQQDIVEQRDAVLSKALLILEND